MVKVQKLVKVRYKNGSSKFYKGITYAVLKDIYRRAINLVNFNKEFLSEKARIGLVEYFETCAEQLEHGSLFYESQLRLLVKIFKVFGNNGGDGGIKKLLDDFPIPPNNTIDELLDALPNPPKSEKNSKICYLEPKILTKY